MSLTQVIENSHMAGGDGIFMVFQPAKNYARIPGFRDTPFGISCFGVPESVAEWRMPQNLHPDRGQATGKREE